MSVENLIRRRDRYFGKGAPLFYSTPVHIVRGEGAWLFDADGKRYVDMYNNVPCVGHANPHVVEAMHRQASTLNVHSRYLHEGIVDFAERLVGLHDESMQSVVFTCTGTEANEVAMTMARVATGGQGFICTDAAYHGNSQQVGQLSHVPVDQTGNKNVRSIPFPQLYRPVAEGVSETELTELYLGKVAEVIEGFRRDNIAFAGMLVCPLLANEGLPNIPSGFMSLAANMVRDAGGLFIIDEVQSGYCRSGQWWGYQVMGVVPDIVTMGKPMGNGLPLAAVAASREMIEQYRARVRYFNTFASTPLQAAVGMAVLDVIEQESLASRAAELGQYLRTELKAMAQGCPQLAEVRGHGLFIGLEWVVDKASKTPDREGAIKLVDAMKDKGFLMSNAGAMRNVVKIRPPLVFDKAQGDAFLQAMDETLKTI